MTRLKPFGPLFAALALGACATVPADRAPAPEPVKLRIIGLNDFHGNLEPLRRTYSLTMPDGGKEEVKVGGLAAYSAVVNDLRRQDEYSLVIGAGDMISASPLISSLFLDEPTVTGLSAMGLDISAVGNHEFDRGWRELKRVQDGGCEKLANRDPCQVAPFEGAKYTILSASTVFEESGESLFPASAIRSFGEGENRVTVGVIGLTLEDTPTLVTPSGVDGLIFFNEADAINGEVEKLAAQGVDAVIVAIHQGLYSDLPYDAPGCDGINGPLLEILERIDSRVDLVLSGHTHQAYVCDYSTIDPARDFLVTSAGYGGSFVTDVSLTVDPAANDVVESAARNVLVRADGSTAGALDPAAGSLVATYAEASRQAAQRPVGRISGDARDPGPATEETPLGNAIADAQLFATREAGAEIALMNNSGIRTGITPQADGTITFGDIYAVQPFGNTLVTKTFTGAQLLRLLEQQFDDDGFIQTFSVSEGFRQTYDLGRPVGSRLVSATLGGKPIDPARNYRVTMNSFLAAGGDDFTVFENGTDAAVGPVDLDAFEEWLRQEEVRALPPEGRVSDATAR